MHIFHNKVIYLASYYKPPNDHTTSLEVLHESLAILYHGCKLPPSVIIAGDLNLPDINWKNLYTTNQHTATKLGILGLLKHTIHPATPKVKETAYTMLVRPKLEYGTVAWSPYTQNDIDTLEKSQITAARFTLNDHRRKPMPRPAGPTPVSQNNAQTYWPYAYLTKQ